MWIFAGSRVDGAAGANTRPDQDPQLSSVSNAQQQDTQDMLSLLRWPCQMWYQIYGKWMLARENIQCTLYILRLCEGLESVPFASCLILFRFILSDWVAPNQSIWSNRKNGSSQIRCHTQNTRKEVFSLLIKLCCISYDSCINDLNEVGRGLLATPE